MFKIQILIKNNSKYTQLQKVENTGINLVY